MVLNQATASRIPGATLSCSALPCAAVANSVLAGCQLQRTDLMRSSSKHLLSGQCGELGQPGSCLPVAANQHPFVSLCLSE